MSQTPNTHNKLIIKGARHHNLKSIFVEIDYSSITVVTGISGSGKSSLVFDTIYAEGQRRYVESLSSYARQFLGRMPKPEVDFIDGLAPAIAIEQKVITRNPRSTVATSTEIYDYLKLLFARYGKIYSPISGLPVERQGPDDIWKFILNNPVDTSFTILSQPIAWKSKHTVNEQVVSLIGKGFIRIYDNELGFIRIDKDTELPKSLKNSYVVLDRLALSNEEDLRTRAMDSIDSALWEGGGTCSILIENEDTKQIHSFTDTLEADGVLFEEPNLNNMSFNSPSGACVRCGGLGEVNDIDPDLVIPNGSLSVYDDCVLPWKSETMSAFKQDFLRKAVLDDFPIHRAYDELTEVQKQYLWEGNKKNNGINDFFKYLEEKSYKIQYRVMLSRYRGRTVCPDCKGTKLRKEAGFVKLISHTEFEDVPQQVNLHNILLMQVEKAYRYFSSVKFEGVEGKASERIVDEIKSRLEFLYKVGLGYLSLHRMSNTLSGGESQRIRLATALGSTLTGSLYILDEPSIGLHPKDTQDLIEVLKRLKQGGNTVIVVEHEEEIMKAADKIIDIGPLAGIHGGEVTFSGTHEELIHAENSLTAEYLTGKKVIPLPKQRRISKNFISIKGAREHNLKNISVDFPLENFTVVTGVSGSGKTTLVKKILYPGLMNKIGGYSGIRCGKHSHFEGKFNLIKNIEMIDQNPLGRSSRSNPVTYVKAWDHIRELLSEQPLSKNRKYKPAIFSFNVEGGRCEHCKGDGEVTIEMQFMADIVLPCEYCLGKRFKDEVLEVEYKGKSVADILQFSVEESILFFEGNKSIVEKLLPLQKVGLGYIKLGQSTGTLSGGEAQRVKLASFLGKGGNTDPILFIFDEPTTGLHFHDIVKLLDAFQALVDKGHTLIVIEHNMEVIKSADYVIDLGPTGGDEGGQLVFQGTPEGLAQCENSITAKFLKEKL